MSNESIYLPHTGSDSLDAPENQLPDTDYEPTKNEMESANLNSQIERQARLFDAVFSSAESPQRSGV